MIMIMIMTTGMTPVTHTALHASGLSGQVSGCFLIDDMIYVARVYTMIAMYICILHAY